MRICKHCGTDMATVPPTSAITKHLIGLCAPAHVDAEQVIAGLEIEDEREREAVRRQCQREKSPPIEVNNWTVAWIIATGAVLGALCLYAFAWARAIGR
jgi:hypothetical protein